VSIQESLTVFAVIRHEAAHVSAAYLRLGPDAIKSVTRQPAGNLLGCASSTIPDDIVVTKHPKLQAMDAAVILCTPFWIEVAKGVGDIRGSDRDIRKASSECAPIAYAYAGKVADPDVWVEDWMHQVHEQVEELIDSRAFWRGVNAIEFALDRWPTLSGDVVRPVLDEALA
jgi:hypothetical protein